MTGMYGNSGVADCQEPSRPLHRIRGGTARSTPTRGLSRPVRVGGVLSRPAGPNHRRYRGSAATRSGACATCAPAPPVICQADALEVTCLLAGRVDILVRIRMINLGRIRCTRIGANRQVRRPSRIPVPHHAGARRRPGRDSGDGQHPDRERDPTVPGGGRPAGHDARRQTSGLPRRSSRRSGRT